LGVIIHFFKYIILKDLVMYCMLNSVIGTLMLLFEINDDDDPMQVSLSDILNKFFTPPPSPLLVAF